MRLPVLRDALTRPGRLTSCDAADSHAADPAIEDAVSQDYPRVTRTLQGGGDRAVWVDADQGDR
jgi:hypothetical protein